MTPKEIKEFDFDEFIEYLNSLDIVEKRSFERDFYKELVENQKLEKEFVKELWDKWFAGMEFLDEIDIDKHRWCEYATCVYKLKTGDLLGIHCITQMYSEGSSLDDFESEYRFYQMKEIKVVSYTYD